MNKKIIAIAIASAMAAPAAMADVTVSGAFYGEILSLNAEAANGSYNEANGQSTMTFADGGKNTLAFTATSGNVYGKMGLNVGPGSAAPSGDFQPTYRDFFIGYKLGGDASIQFGTMNGAVKNLEKDAYIATFLQSRGTYADAVTAGKYGSSSYVSNVIQYKGKVGNGTLIAQYNPNSDVADAFNNDEGHMGISYAAKAGGVSYYVGYNNGAGGDATTTDDTNMKIGASMKFGSIKAGLDYSTADTGTADETAIAVNATMDLGNGMSANVLMGSTTASAGGNEGTYTRLAVTKSLAKNASIYAGYANHNPDGGDAATIIGIGMGVKF